MKPSASKNNLCDALEATALRLLAQREHTRFELVRKLTSRGYLQADIHRILDKLAAEGWQSDARFLEAYIVERAKKGYGPLRILSELQQRGLDSEQIQSALLQASIDWSHFLRALHQKKFHQVIPQDYREKAKQIRFLQYRGFDLAQIQDLLVEIE